ncbi:sigma-70 family RNA polymerase sigma factor [Staphylococcus taiwanensis]|nr:sigma-70 family RNA polymerase sigma factor [Staphylococcus taiwanensis]
MNFDEIYIKHHRIIHYLLKQYHITYNYDEFYQLLLIKFWELSQCYDCTSNICLSSFLYTRLKFYLIDIFRKESLSPETTSTDEVQISPYDCFTFENLIHYRKDISQLLNHNELTWFHYFMQGYKQYEIAKLMNMSISTIKKYKSSTIKKFHAYVHEGV